jgi:hypothetical protein
VPEEEIKSIESVLTIVGGKVVHAEGEFSPLAPPPLPVSPAWSPVKEPTDYANAQTKTAPVHESSAACSPHHAQVKHSQSRNWRSVGANFWLPGCDCFVF